MGPRDVTTREILDFHARPAAMTSGGGHATLFDALPRDVAALARVAQGLLLHEHWANAYGAALSAERRGESHLRPAARMLERLLAHDGAPACAGDRLERRAEASRGGLSGVAPATAAFLVGAGARGRRRSPARRRQARWAAPGRPRAPSA
ncbi:uncharacterized protein SOCEGT47_008150 [Sorangium cellulosum]|uniref:Uncharacterized protein n=1 Tax=Sorangium cellulosum TaxID=56 RepID=A0A4P2PUH8_SORCE|nr:hypothetical protein [Sorangium cellulosum]AUX20347.1 uncharacterized protein SOCEGT47_008150 [Sorangium cellulosum]